ncbi:MAG: hypothetical protein AB7F59_06260 [Bdellovibrionales bacterium]
MFNNTVGYIPVLLRASDLHIVRGPVNIFEGLNLRTPTLVFNNEWTLGNYDASAYMEAVDLVKKYPAFREISNMKEFDVNAQALLKIKNVHPLYKAQNYKLLRQLLTYIEERLSPEKKT